MGGGRSESTLRFFVIQYFVPCVNLKVIYMALTLTLSFNSSVFGIRAAIDMRDLSAHNISNSNTDEYKKQRVNLSEGANNGVFVNISGSTETGVLYKNEKDEIIETSNVNFPEEIAVQINATHLLSANIAVINRTDEAYKDLLDIIA